MKRQKRAWKGMTIGKIGSPRYEWFEICKMLLRSHYKDGEKKLIKYCNHDFKEESKFFKTYLKQSPLGAEFLRIAKCEKDPMTLILKSHLMLEIYIDEIIKKKFVNGEKLLQNQERLGFLIKLDILQAKNLVKEDLYSDIKVINSLRNKYAHKYFYDFADFDMSQFYYCDGIYDRIPVRSINGKRAVNLFMMRLVLESILARLEEKHVYLGKIKVPPAVIRRRSAPRP